MIQLARGYQTPACVPARTPYRGAVYAFAFAWSAAAAYLWPLSFTALAALMSLLLLPLWARGGERAWPIFALLFALAVWGAGTFAWSPALARVDPQNVETQAGLKLLLQVAAYGVFAAGAAGLSGGAARRVLMILALGLALLGVVLVAEGASMARLYQSLHLLTGEPIRPDLAERNVGRGQFVLALLAWPVFVFLYEERRSLIWLIAGALLLAPFALEEQAPTLAFLAGGVAFLCVRVAGPLGARLLGGLLAVQVLISPWVVRMAVDAGLFEAAARVAPPSWDARLQVWRFAAERILERPLLGWGLEASRTFPGVPLHPHNAGLQLWLELGVVGAVLFALIWLRLFESLARLARRDRTAAAASAAAAGAYFTIGALSYGVWQEWWLGFAAVLAAACAALVVVRDHDRMAWPPGDLHRDRLTPL